MNTQHGYGTDTPSRNYNILFSTCNHNNRHENPVRDNNISHTLFLKKDEHEYKDHYGVSDFKFPETTPKVLRKNRVNFCELSFDGTKSTKHHHRRNNTIKRVTNVTAINCDEKKEIEEEQEVEKKSNKDTMTFHHLAEQFKNKLKFIETPIKMHKNMVPNDKQTGSTFKVILSPKIQTSFTSIETMSNILQSSDNKIIVTQMNKPNMRDREIQTAIIGIRGVDEYFNMRLSSVNNIFYNMDLLSSNEELFNVKRNKRKKLNLTMTNLPCVEIKCSSILFEMPANAVRPQMPRRTLNTNNSIIEDFHEASTASVEEKPSEPVTVNSSERTDNFLKDKLFNLFNDTQITTSDDYNKKVNDLCGLISNLLTENKNIHEKNVRKSVKMPGEMLLNITKLKAGDSSINTNDNDTSQQNTLIIPSYNTHKNNLYDRSSNTTPNRSNHSIPPNRLRSLTPPSRPSTPTCQISKISAAESINQMYETNQTATRSESKLCSNTTPNLTAGIQNHKFSFTSNPSFSTISNGMGYDDSEDNIKQTPQVGTPVPRTVFLIPPHVNEILKNCEYNDTHMNRKINEFGDLQKPSLANNFNNPNASDFHLIKILKKPSIKHSWLTPDFVNTSQLKCDTVNHFQCSKPTKQKKNERDCGGPSVTFNTMVDVFGDNESLEEQKCSTPPSKNTSVPITGLKHFNTYPNKPELYAVNDREETSYENCGFFTARQCETNKAKPHYEKQASFYNSSFLLTKKDTDTSSNAISCLQKRKEYDHQWKMQLQRQNKQASKIPRIEQENGSVKNEPFKTAKSKLPLKVTNNKLFTTDIKDTLFIQKNSRNHAENNENVTKDVVARTKKSYS